LRLRLNRRGGLPLYLLLLGLRVEFFDNRFLGARDRVSKFGHRTSGGPWILKQVRVRQIYGLGVIAKRLQNNAFSDGVHYVGRRLAFNEFGGEFVFRPAGHSRIPDSVSIFLQSADEAITRAQALGHVLFTHIPHVIGSSRGS